MLIFFLSFAFVSSFVYDCSSIDGKSPVTYDVATTCMKSLKFERLRKVESIDFVIKMMEYYVFKDIATKSGPPWNHNIDILKELQELKTRTWETDFDFHDDIRKTIARLKDAHLSYVPPMCYYFVFLQPFAVRQSSSRDFYVTNFWSADTKLKIPGRFKKVYPEKPEIFENHYDGMLILEINGKDPFEVIKKYANEECSYSRDPKVRYNQVLKSEWHKRGVSRGMPTESSIRYKLRNIDSNEVVEIEAPWIAVPIWDYSTEDRMEVMCGYEGKFDQERGRRRSLLGGGSSKSRKDELMTEIISGHGAQHTSMLDMYTSLLQSFNMNSDLRWFVGKYIEEIVQFAKEKLVDSQMDIYEMNRMIENHIIIPEFQQEEESTEGEEEDRESSAPKGYVPIPLPFEDLREYFKLYRHEEKTDLALLKVTTFMPDSTNCTANPSRTCANAFLIQMRHVFKELTPYNKLLIDVRGNGGGIVCYAYMLLSYLSPYTPLSADAPGDEVYTKLGDLLKCENDIFSPIIFFDQERNPVSDDWYRTGPQRQRGEDGYFTRFSSLVHLNCGLVNTVMSYVASHQEEEFKNKDHWKHSPKMFEPENIVVFTDGTCGSTCGTFVRVIQALKLGKIVSQGGYSGGKRDMNSASFPGASVTVNPGVEKGLIELLFCPLPKYSELRIKKPRTSAFLTVSNSESFPWNPISTYELEKVDDSIPVDYISVPADFHMENNWDFTDDVLGDPGLLQYFDVCANWEIKRDDDCDPSLERIENAVYGHPCIKGKFANDVCLLRGCDRGYYLSESEKACEKMPEDDMMAFWDIVMEKPIVKSVIMGSLYVSLAVLVCFCCYCACGVMSVALCVVLVVREFAKLEKVRDTVDVDPLSTSRESVDSSFTTSDSSMNNSGDAGMFYEYSSSSDSTD